MFEKQITIKMIPGLEEISRVCVNNGIIIVQRKIYCNKNIWDLQTPEEELEQERAENNGRTLHEINVLLRESMEHIHTETRIECLQVVLELVCQCDSIKPMDLTSLYRNIDDMLELCECAILRNIREKILSFYLSHPFRMLELSESISEEILTVEACLTPPFIPYLTRKLSTPKWMVPVTVRTMNDACRIYQTREFVKKEGMDLFVILIKNRALPFVLWKMVAHYAVDLDKLHFDLFPVITEKMLKNGYNDLVEYRQLDLSTRVPAVVVTV